MAKPDSTGSRVMPRGGSIEVSDAEILAAFEHSPRQAWKSFLAKHSQTIFTQLQRLGFDYDEAIPSS